MICVHRPAATGPILSVLLLAACPKNSGQVPTWGGDGDGEDVLAAHDPPPTDDDGIEGANDGDAVAAADLAADPAAYPTPDAGDERGAETPSAGTPTEPTPLSLPKPLYGKVDASCGKDEGLGTKLKPFALKSVDGKPSSNASFRGRVMLVNFWGTWCKPCLKELPEFDQLYRRYRKHGLTLVAIATDEDPAPVKEYIDRRKIAAKVLIGAEDYAGEYGSPKFPFTFVVDDKGVIKASYRGYRPECMGKLESDLRAQLEARAAK